MYVVVVYDAAPGERKKIRRKLKTQLHWIQNSVYAGEMTKTAAVDLYDALEDEVEGARVTFWMFDRKPDTRLIGGQDDEESMFV